MTLNANDLKPISQDKHKNNRILYKSLLEDCEKRIKHFNSLGLNEGIIKIPYMKLGYPLFNMTHAIMYIIRKLTKQSFKIGYIYENTMHVSWKVRTK